MSENLITAKAVCERLGVSRTTLWRMCQDRAITFIRVGGHIRFDTAAIDAFILKSTVPAKEKAGRDASKRGGVRGR